MPPGRCAACAAAGQLGQGQRPGLQVAAPLARTLKSAPAGACDATDQSARHWQGSASGHSTEVDTRNSTLHWTRRESNVSQRRERAQATSSGACASESTEWPGLSLRCNMRIIMMPG